MNKTINILTRTSGRPNYFKENCKSIKAQTYPHIKHIVCADDDYSFDYASRLCDHVVRLDRPKKREEYGIMHSPYNLYCNRLMDEVEDGWIFFLDDDNIFKDDSSVNTIMNSTDSEDDLLIWKGEIHNKIIPSFSFGKGVALADIDTFCFMFHSKHKWAAQWDEVKESDFRVALKLFRLLKVKWIDKIIAKVNNDITLHGPTGVGLGNRKDKK